MKYKEYSITVDVSPAKCITAVPNIFDAVEAR